MANGCGCADCTTAITSLTGATGAAGTSTVVATSGLAATATVEHFLTTQRLDTASNAVAPYTWSIVTIPTVATTNVAVFNVNAEVTATGAHDLTLTVVDITNPASPAVVANLSRTFNSVVTTGVSFNFEISNVVSAAIYGIIFTSSDVGVTPLLTGGHSQITIYA